MAYTKQATKKAPAINVNVEKKTEQSINRISVTGFKSICEEQSIEVRPLTILAGANSSGKSSIMQPLLLLKQTYEANFDPGPLLLIGEHVKFTSTEQIICSVKNAKQSQGFQVMVGSEDQFFKTSFIEKNKNLIIDSWLVRIDDVTLLLRPGQEFYTTTLLQVLAAEGLNIEKYSNIVKENFPFRANIEQRSGIPILTSQASNENLLDALASVKKKDLSNRRDDSDGKLSESYIATLQRHQKILSSGPRSLLGQLSAEVLKIIHLPVIRGNKERAYPITAIRNMFAGPFPVYAASIIENWQQKQDLDHLNGLFGDMRLLGLTSKVVAKRINGAQLEVLVSRLVDKEPRAARDLVNLVDVGFGVTQVLPVIVALHAAEPGRLVYIEQPENDLHPRAQVALAQVLASAAKRGVRLVVETHSSLLLLGIQALVAEGKLDPKLVKLHWFTRDKRGVTKISSSELDSFGAFDEEWPSDFSEVELQAQLRFLNATDLKNASLVKEHSKSRKNVRG